MAVPGVHAGHGYQTINSLTGDIPVRLFTLELLVGVACRWPSQSGAWRARSQLRSCKRHRRYFSRWRASILWGFPRARPRAASLQSGVALSGLVSSWAAFTGHSALFLKRKRTLAKRGAKWTASMMPQDGMEAYSEVGSTGMLKTEPREPCGTRKYDSGYRVGSYTAT